VACRHLTGTASFNDSSNKQRGSTWSGREGAPAAHDRQLVGGEILCLLVITYRSRFHKFEWHSYIVRLHMALISL
jgi:hypothetical protein